MRIRDAFGPGKNDSPDRLYMIRLEDAHHTRQAFLFALAVPLHAARLTCLLIYRHMEEAGSSGGRLWHCATLLRNTSLDALLDEASQVQYGIVDMLDSSRWSRVVRRDLLKARSLSALECEDARRGGGS